MEKEKGVHGDRKDRSRRNARFNREENDDQRDLGKSLLNT